MMNIYLNALPFLILLAYPPLIFTDKISDGLRVTVFFLLTAFLSFSSKSFSRRQVLSLLLFVILIGVQIFLIDFDNSLDVLNAGSLFLTLAFAIALDRSSTSKALSRIFSKLYVYLFTLIPILMICAIGFYFIFADLNLFELNIGDQRAANTFILTPFGALLPKFTGSSLLRSTSFFHEPVLLSFFLAINTFLPLSGSGFCGRNFNKLNIVGGIMTLSFLYFIVVIPIFLWRLRLRFKTFEYLGILVFVFMILLSQFDFQYLETLSSFGDRLARINIYFSIFPDLSSIDLLFGSGFNADTGFDKYISTGFLALLYKLGIVGLVSISTLVWIFARNNAVLIIASLFALLTFEPYLYPLFWFAITSYVVLSKESSEYVRNSVTAKDFV